MDKKFYVGWSDDNPKELSVFRRSFYLIILLIGVLFTILITIISEPFIPSRFEYGTLTELDGQLVDYPVLGLRTTFKNKEATVPLVGFGKFSAESAFQEYDISELIKSQIKIRGTIISYQNKVWMELTEGKESILEVRSTGSPAHLKISKLPFQKIKGEIVDPKCFFGVMNPAYKKIHRSCAIRCISGGIPPVLAVRENGQFVDYYFLVGEDDQIVHNNLARYAGLPIELEGNVEIINDWKIIKLGDSRPLVLNYRLDDNLELCIN